MAVDKLMVAPSTGSVRTLGSLWIVYGIFRLLSALLLVVFNATATLMFGALLTRVPNPFALMNDFHLVYACLVGLSVLAGVFGVLAGLALVANQSSARLLGLIASFLSVSEIPFGTTLGIYTLIILLPRRSGAEART
jgi:hypothetical protein